MIFARHACGMNNERKPTMTGITRREAREQALFLLFETEFHPEKDPQEIYALAVEDRDLADEPYIRAVYFGVLEKKTEIDGAIARYSRGWTVDRIAPLTRNLLRVAVYEMTERDDIPARVAINEAVELVKKYDQEKARAFVNGILNGIMEGMTPEKSDPKEKDTK